MYYSILPVDHHMDCDIEYEEVIYNDQLMLTKKINNIQMIERLYSSNPADYLNPKLQPGTILQNPLINRP